MLNGDFNFAIILFFVAVGILWFLLPFAIFGTKDKLDALIKATEANTAAVNSLHETMRSK